MKQIFILSILVSLTIDLSSQSSVMPVILISSDKKIIHEDQVKTNIVPGSIMNKSGKLILATSSKALIYHDFSFVSIDASTSPIDLSTIFTSQEALIPESEANLGEYISDAVYNALTSGVTMKNQNALVSGWGSKGSGRDGWGSKGSGRDGWGSKGSGRDGWGSKGSGRDGWGSKGSGRDGWGSKGSGRDGWGSKGSGRDGWGSKGSSRDGWAETEIITRSTVPGGDYLEGNNLLQWEKIKGAKEYQFVIEDESNNIVYTSKVKANQFTLNSAIAKLELGKDYAWYVHHPTKREVSTPVPFRIMSSKDLNAAIEAIKDLKLYKNADNVTKQLMEAYQLHQKGWLLASQNAYLSTIKQNPKNNLGKMMYSFFCIELGEVESAASALK